MTQSRRKKITTGFRIFPSRSLRLTLGLFISLTLGAMAARADQAQIERGEVLFKECHKCHEIGPGAKNKVGPHLDGIEGRTAAAVGDFNYSKAMRKAGAEGLVWSADTINDYLEKPRNFVPGNRMSFRGMKKPDDRAALIAYLFSVGRAEPNRGETAASAQPQSMAALVLQTPGDPDYGEYLSSECVTCHQASGHADGIPSIVGLPPLYFVRSLLEYKNNIRNNEVMKLMVTPMGNEEMAALAAYFGAQTPE